MSQGILSLVAREVRNAFRARNMHVVVFGKVFIIEHVNGMEYRLTTATNEDVGVRFIADGKNDVRVFCA